MGNRLSVNEMIKGRKLLSWKKTPLFLLPPDPSLALLFLMKLCTYNNGCWSDAPWWNLIVRVNDKENDNYCRQEPMSRNVQLHYIPVTGFSLQIDF